MKVAKRELLKRWLEGLGWFVRRTNGLSVGANIFYDLQSRLDIHDVNVIVDVGAHRGETVSQWVSRFPKARVLAVEPVEDNFRALQKAVEQNGWVSVSCLNAALGRTRETVRIIRQADSQTHSLRYRASAADERSEEVSVLTLDDVMSSQEIERIDLLKIDTEGFEIAVLDGGRQSLLAGRIEAILLEASLDARDDVHSSLLDVIAFLSPLKFGLVGIYDQMVWRNPYRLAYFNALFVRYGHVTVGH